MSQNISSAFPKSRLDAMIADAVSFDRLNPSRGSAVRWDWSQHMDAAEAIYIARQLEFIRQGIYEVRYPELKARRLIPHNMSLDPGTEQYTARSIDVAGDASVSKDQPDDIPMVELSVKSATMDMYSMVLGYAYSDQEARAAMLARIPLPNMKAKAVRDRMARRLDTIAFSGEKVTGIVGLLNASGTTTYTPSTTASDGGKTWALKDADSVLADINGAGNQIVTDTDEIEVPDTWLFPLTSHTLISNRRVGDGTSSTILKYFLENNDMVKAVERTQKAELAGSGGTARRLTVYKNDASKLEMMVPLEFEQKMPQARGFKVYTYCHMRTGGLSLYLPKSVCYADGI